MYLLTYLHKCIARTKKSSN